MSELGRVSIAARVFTLAGLVSVAALMGAEVLRGAIAVSLVAAWALVLSATGRLPGQWVAIAEGAAVGILATVMWPHSNAVTPYLVVPVLLGGLMAGAAGVFMVLLSEALVTSVAWLSIVGTVDRIALSNVLVWVVAGLGLGMLGVAFRRTLNKSGAVAPYRDALDLIKQLHALSGRLTSGLDAVSLAEQVMDQATRRLDIAQSVVMVRSQAGTLTPLRFSDGAATEPLLTALDWADRVWHNRRPSIRGHRVAIPLASETQTIALLIADCINAPEARTVEAVNTELMPKAVQLNAAMLFGDVRDRATSEERQRLAREVHDGVAQDVASLGYLVDNLTEMTADEEQLDQLRLLREEVTRVVAELRHSVFDLRNDVRAGQGLGQSISSFARHIGSHSDLTVHVTLNEAAARLRPDVESELLRIAQEAINNARKHSRGKNLWVSCSVHPPSAVIEVRDDGDGLGPGRADSHGLRIMRERAARIGAALDIETSPEDQSGTRVFVQLPARVRSLSQG